MTWWSNLYQHRWIHLGIRLLEVLLLLLIVAAVLFPASPKRQLFPSRDSGVFLYAGWRVTQGDIPYRDIWDHKPPVIFYINALGLWLDSESTWGVWAIEFTFLFAASLIAYHLIKKVFDWHTAIFISALWLINLTYLLIGGNLTTEYTLPMQFGGLALFYLAEKRNRYTWYGPLIGVLIAIAFFTRQNSIGFGAAIILFLLISRIQKRQFLLLAKQMLGIFLGFLFISLIVIGYFAYHNALYDFWDIAFSYNFFYSDERDNIERLKSLSYGLARLERLGLSQFAFMGFGMGILWLFSNRDAQQTSATKSLVTALILALPIELVLVSLPGRPRLPYFTSLLPVFSLLAGFFIWRIFEYAKQYSRPKPAKSFLLLVMLCALSLISYSDYLDIANRKNFSTAGQQTVDFLKENTQPEDTVLIWGAETSINFLARRAAPTRYVYLYPLIKSPYVNEEKLLEFYQDIIDQKPKYIIATMGKAQLQQQDFGFYSEKTHETFSQMISAYHPLINIEEWSVYERIEP